MDALRVAINPGDVLGSFRRLPAGVAILWKESTVFTVIILSGCGAANEFG